MCNESALGIFRGTLSGDTVLRFFQSFPPLSLPTAAVGRCSSSQCWLYPHLRFPHNFSLQMSVQEYVGVHEEAEELVWGAYPEVDHWLEGEECFHHRGECHLLSSSSHQLMWPFQLSFALFLHLPLPSFVLSPPQLPIFCVLSLLPSLNQLLPSSVRSQTWLI